VKPLVPSPSMRYFQYYSHMYCTVMRLGRLHSTVRGVSCCGLCTWLWVVCRGGPRLERCAGAGGLGGTGVFAFLVFVGGVCKNVGPLERPASWCGGRECICGTVNVPRLPGNAALQSNHVINKWGVLTSKSSGLTS
jgi:hypothetical protein